MTKLSILILLISVSIILSNCDTPKKNIVEKRPNVILILTDDQGWGDLSLQGNPNLNTPNIDQLAQNGAVFDRFYVSPVCSPTRAEILTGRYHVRGGVYSTSEGGERLDLDEITMADNFKLNGYKTAAFGKWHNGMQYPYHPNARGFDEFYGFCSGHWGNYFSPLLEHNGKIVKGEGYLTDDLTNHAVQFIEENKKDPFFLYIPYNTPHSPMQVPDQLWSKFKNKNIDNNYDYKDEKSRQHAKAAYAMCENIDWNVGRVSNKIKELGLEENTIIIFLSDNGPNGWRWNGGMKGIKGSTNEGGVRSPLIMQWKGKIKEGKKIEQIASAIDLLPTLADMTGIELIKSKPLDGKSLKSIIIENNEIWEDRYLVSYWNHKTSIRNQQFRMDHKNKLYDMQIDPGQKEDVSEKHPIFLKEMIDFKNKWQKDVLSELPTIDERNFPVAHPAFKYTQLPARDATPHGNIQRSNRFPNCTFFTNWIDIEDKITWDIEVLQDGNYEAILYYTCNEENIGSSLELSFGKYSIQKKITKAHDPPLVGHEKDRVKRQESYTKDFKPMDMGVLKLDKGLGILTLKSLDIKGSEVMDFRLIMLNRVER